MQELHQNKISKYHLSYKKYSFDKEIRVNKSGNLDLKNNKK